MAVLMMNIRIMRVGVRQRQVLMLMRMGFTTIPFEIMRMLMVFIVDMAMSVPHAFMLMYVGMLLG